MDETPTVVRDLYLPRELVFEAFTQALHLAEWFVPDGCAVQGTVVEPQVGGRFEITWRDEAGALTREAGRFTAVDPPAGFVCTIQESARGASAGETRLSLDLDDRVDACRVRLREEVDVGPSPVPETRRREWEDRLDRLEAYFSAI